MLQAWNIYLHFPHIYGPVLQVNIPYMEHMGIYIMLFGTEHIFLPVELGDWIPGISGFSAADEGI